MSCILGHVEAGPLCQLPGIDIGREFVGALSLAALDELVTITAVGPDGGGAQMNPLCEGTEDSARLVQQLDKLRREGEERGIEIRGEAQWESGDHTRRVGVLLADLETRVREGTIGWEPYGTMESEN